MQIEFKHPITPANVVPWQPGEILTVQIANVDADGNYIAETMETFPPDLKQRHASELAQLHADHKARVEELLARLEPAAPEDAGGASS